MPARLIKLIFKRCLHITNAVNVGVQLHLQVCTHLRCFKIDGY